jgi:hypothetical protein
MQKCGVVVGWTNTSDRLGDDVRTSVCDVQAALVLTGENGLYVWGYPTAPDGIEEVFWHVI